MSKKHEWAKWEGEIATVGLTKEAIKEFGEVVFIQLPELHVEAKESEPICVIESNKAASDVHSPVSGTVIEVNTALKSNMKLLNEFPESDGWIYKVKK